VVTGPVRRPLARLIVRVFAWLPVTFAIWYFAAPFLLWPAAFLAELVARFAWADIVRGVEQAHAELAFATTLRAGSAGAQGGEIVVGVNLLLYSFGLPLYAALVLAAKEPGWPRRLLIGYAVLMPFVAWGALADFLQSVAITMGPQIASQAGFVAWQREAIAFSYQFGALMLPTVVPVAAWVVMHRALLERLRFRPGAS
jgi:hypothetical protein